MTDETIDSLQRLVLSKVPNATMAFWGGSLVQHNAVAQSDYDIVVLAPHIEKPVSYNNVVNPDDRRKADIIVRDPETLAFELQDARYTGKSTVARLIADGVPVFGPTKNAMTMKRLMQKFIAHGADMLSNDVYQARYHALKKDFVFSPMLNREEKELLAFEQRHEMTSLFLRTQRQWVASGKILGRYMVDYSPMIENDLATAYKDGNLSVLFDRMQTPENLLPNAVDIATQQAILETDKELQCQFMVRHSQDYLCKVMNNGSSVQRKIAENYLGNKLMMITQSVDRERFERPSNEYFYALARVVYTMGDLYHAQSGMEREWRYKALNEAQPDFYDAVKRAERGQPEKLQLFMLDYTEKLNPNAGAESIRSSPTTFRSEAGALKNLI
jgi:hypothetical protein